MKKIWLNPDIMNNMQNTQRSVYQLVELAAKHCPKVLPGTWFSTSLHSGPPYTQDLDCRTAAAGDLHPVQQEAFPHQTGSSLQGTSPMLAKIAFLHGFPHLKEQSCVGTGK